MKSKDPGSESDKRAALAASHPILSCADSTKLEEALLDSDSKVWEAMQSVGRQLGRGIFDEYRMTRFSPKALSVFALVGKGHNGGDALLALAELARQGVLGKVVVAIAGSLAELKPNTKHAFDILESQAPNGVLSVFCCRSNGEASWLEEIDQILSGQTFDIVLDGLLGMSFKGPLRSLALGAI
ncbi:MAG: NAD(P)H-hydrate epimerase, partial [Verrucomicrobiia bacterium]